jgi:hypothetical protein
MIANRLDNDTAFSQNKNSRWNKLFARIRDFGTSPAIPFIIFFIISLALMSKVPLQPNNDDHYFSTMHLQYNLPQYLWMRYMTWSGRVSVEILFYYFEGSLFFLWKWLCAISITACAFVLYTVISYGKDFSNKESFLYASLSCLSFFLINSGVLSPSVFWVTGALAYLIPTSLALIAFMPFFFSIRNPVYQPRRAFVCYLIAAILTAIGQEQAALCFVAFAVLTIIYLLAQKRKISTQLWIILAVSVLLLAVSLAAPGDALRSRAEAVTWFPSFYSIDIFKRASVTAFFFMQALFDLTYLPLLLIWWVIGTLLWKKNPSRFSRWLSILSFLFAILMTLRLIHPLDTSISSTFKETIQKWFTFHYLSRGSFSHPDQYLDQLMPYVFWGTGLLLVPFSIWTIYKRTRFSFFYIFIFIGAMTSILITAFSPTLFASGGRTDFVSSVLLILLIMFLLSEKGQMKTLAAMILAIALIKLFMLSSTWLNHGGYQFWYGGFNIKEIPFEVLGK